jgi:hypothetical protein
VAFGHNSTPERIGYDERQIRDSLRDRIHNQLVKNVGLWRCWSDKLVFEIRRVEAAKTQVEIYAVPNLFRFRTNKNEEAIEVKKLASQLFI